MVGGELQDVDLVVSRLQAARERAECRAPDWIVSDPGPTLDETLAGVDGREARECASTTCSSGFWRL